MVAGEKEQIKNIIFGDEQKKHSLCAGNRCKGDASARDAAVQQSRSAWDDVPPAPPA